MFKQYLKVAAALAAAALLVTGCGLRSADPTSNEAGGDKIKLTFSFWEPSTGRELETVLSDISEEYSKLHPEVTVELMSQPNSGYQEWVQSQFASNNAPDIEYNQPSNLNKQVESDFIIDISEYLDKPNPYNGSDTPWRDDFVDGRLSAAQAFKGDSCCIPLSGLGIAYYYNQELYDKAGIKAPKTWDEMIDNFKKLEQSGVTPVAFMGQKSDAVDWLSWEIATALLSEDLLADPELNYNGDNNIDSYELFKALDQGIYDISKEGKYRDYYEKYLSYMQEYGKYCTNASGLDEAGAKAMFLSGKAATIMSGSWDLKSFTTDEKLPFKIGTFAFPKFTTRNTEHPGDNMAIVDVSAIAITTNAAKSDAKKEAAVDFVRFLTSQDMYKKFIEGTYSIPVMNNFSGDESFVAFRGGSRAPVAIYAMGNSSGELTNANVNLMAISGEKVDFNNATKKIQQNFVDQLESLKKSKEGFTPENNYLIDTLPRMLGDFKPYDPKD